MGVVYTWIRNVEHRFRVKNIPEEWKYEKAIDTLKGSALNWRTSTEGTNKINHWESLKELMISRYGIPDLQRKLRRGMLKQKEFETVSDHVNRFMNIRAQIIELSIDV